MKKIIGLIILNFGFVLAISASQPINSTAIMTNFYVGNAQGDINGINHHINVIYPVGANLSNQVVTFTSTAPNVIVKGNKQISGVSKQNFNNPIIYYLLASDGTKESYVVNMTTSAVESYAYMQTFGLISSNTGINKGIIVGNNITVTVPSSTNLSSLKPVFTYTGTNVEVNSQIQYSSQSAQNFTSPIVYTVYAKDGTSESYTVTVNHYATTADSINHIEAITSYGIYPGIINESMGTIQIGVPNSVVYNNMALTFDSSGSSIEVGAESQVSGFTLNNYTSPIVYNVISGDGLSNKSYTITVNTNDVFLDVHNLADTIYDNIQYPVSFNITNNESYALNDVTATLNIKAPYQWTLSSDTCTGNTIAASGGTCSVSGTLSTPNAFSQSGISFDLTDNNGVSYVVFNKILNSIKQINELESTVNPLNYGEYTFNYNGSSNLYAVASVNGQVICFDSNNIGTITNSTSAWGSCSVPLNPRHNTLYIPPYPGIGGKILISFDGTFLDGSSPTPVSIVPASNYYLRWQQVEYGGGLNGASENTLYNLNPTNVNFMSVPISISTVISGVVGPYFNNSYAEQGIVYGDYISTQNVFNVIESNLDNVPQAIPQSWDTLTQYTQDNSKILRILAPSSVFPFMNESSSPFYFNGDFYNQYIDDMWSYYTDNGGGHYFYSNDDPIAASITPGDTCTLQCQVTHVDNLMHCVSYSGECPTNGASGSLDPAFTKFTALDFVSSAGTPDATTYGNDGTYRSVTGENVVSGQSVGFMPFCSNTSFVFGEPEFAANMNLYYSTQYNCLPNFSEYGVSVLDQYSLQSSLYFYYYNYGYSDTLNQPGALYDLNNESYPFTIKVQYN